MSYFNDDTYESFIARDEEIARYQERRYQRMRMELDCWPGEETHCRDEHDFDPENFTMIERKPVQMEALQGELFPEVA